MECLDHSAGHPELCTQLLNDPLQDAAADRAGGQLSWRGDILNRRRWIVHDENKLCNKKISLMCKTYSRVEKLMCSH